LILDFGWGNDALLLQPKSKIQNPESFLPAEDFKIQAILNAGFDLHNQVVLSFGLGRR
jgi:hypothetical protein